MRLRYSLNAVGAAYLSPCTLPRLFSLAATLAKEESKLHNVLYNMESVITQIPELKQDHVHVKNWDTVRDKIKSLIDGNHEKLQIITDFDFTLTKSHMNGDRCSTCYGVIENYSKMPPAFKTKTRELFQKYYPIEIDPHLTVEQKLPSMIQWYDEAHELIMKCNLFKKDFTMMAQEALIYFRDGTNEFLNTLNKAAVPVLVFSAGVGDVIEKVLDVNDLLKENLIHMFNKNESAVRNASYFQDLSHRPNVILMGDSLGDLHMAEGVNEPNTILTIGFLNDKIPERLPKYIEEFDIVLTDDQSMEVPNGILKAILQNVFPH